VAALVAAAAPGLVFAIPVLVVLGALAVSFAATVNSALQIAVEPQMRGRVMALYSVVFLGSTPIGGPIAGWLSEAFDPRMALVLAGVSGLSAAFAARVAFARIESGPAERTAAVPAA
jgi:MFS family permease